MSVQYGRAPTVVTVQYQLLCAFAVSRLGMVELAKILGILVMEPGRQSEMQFPTCLWLFRLAWAWAPVSGWAAAAMEYNITVSRNTGIHREKTNSTFYSTVTVQYSTVDQAAPVAFH